MPRELHPEAKPRQWLLFLFHILNLGYLLPHQVNRQVIRLLYKSLVLGQVMSDQESFLPLTADQDSFLFFHGQRVQMLQHFNNNYKNKSLAA